MPSVFFSYSHDSEQHKQWVLRLAQELQRKRVDVVLDRWDLRLGDDVGKFMERSVRKASCVLAICTPTYVSKSNGRRGGSGYEAGMIVTELVLGKKRVIPVVRGERQVKDINRLLPTAFRGRLALDFRGAEPDGGADERRAFRERVDHLVDQLEGLTPSEPDIGKRRPHPADNETRRAHIRASKTAANVGGDSTDGYVLSWALVNSGDVGRRGADVGAQAAWTISRGVADIRVAILGEGVESQHPDLTGAVFAQRDFIGGQKDARPAGDDAFDTSLAGLVLSRSRSYPGLAPGASLVAARIAMSDGNGGWVFDDFITADAIDWTWRNGADVILLGFGGGAPSDAISRAIARALAQGRQGKGCVVVTAAGNDEGPLDFPATTPGVLVVGASNQWDSPKTMRSQDGEDWWGTSGLQHVSIFAPGVALRTLDLPGRRGYGDKSVNDSFSGTSGAAALVAGAAALVLSVRSDLAGADVIGILTSSAEPLVGEPRVSAGRLNAYAALRLALRADTSVPTAPAKRASPRRTKPTT